LKKKIFYLFFLNYKKVNKKMASKKTNTKKNSSPANYDEMNPQDLLISCRKLAEDKKNLDEQIKKFKLDNNYSQLSKDLLKVKELLYNYMIENDLDKLGGLDLEDFTPNKIKREERIERKKENIDMVLNPVISDPNQRESVVEKIIEHV